MKAPLFNVEADEGAKTASNILLKETRPVKLKRRRALNCTSTLFTVSDSEARECFSDGKDTYKSAYSKRKYAKNIALYYVLFPALFVVFTVIFAVIIFLGELQSAMTEIPALLVLLLILWVASSALAIFLAVLRFCKGTYLKRVFYRLDDVYIIYGKAGAPCIVCVEENRVKVLYSERLTIIYENGARDEITDPKKIYLEYLNLYPQSALDMSAFVKERKKYFLAEETGCRKDVTAVFSERADGCSLSLNASGINVTVRKLHKILYELDKNLNLTAVYSIAGRGRAEYITLATVEKRDNPVLEEMEVLKKTYPRLDVLLKEIL